MTLFRFDKYFPVHIFLCDHILDPEWAALKIRLKAADFSPWNLFNKPLCIFNSNEDSLIYLYGFKILLTHEYVFLYVYGLLYADSGSFNGLKIVEQVM